MHWKVCFVLARLSINRVPKTVEPQVFLNLLKAVTPVNDWKSILTWRGSKSDHGGVSSRARLSHCTTIGLTPAITANVGNSTVQFLVVGVCVRAHPLHYPIKLLASPLYFASDSASPWLLFQRISISSYHFFVNSLSHNISVGLLLVLVKGWLWRYNGHSVVDLYALRSNY